MSDVATQIEAWAAKVAMLEQRLAELLAEIDRLSKELARTYE
jgi:uncharacterized small protein (DUF1192 family)